MAKPAFSKLKLKLNEEFQTIKINDVEIEVRQYLDIAAKSNLIQAVVRGSIIEGIVDEMLMDAYLHVLIFEKYFGVSFTEKQSANILETYDILQSNGIFEQMLEAVPQEEYDYLFNAAVKLADKVNARNNSISGAIDGLIENLSALNIPVDNIIDKLKDTGQSE
jgi:hypothetical protein